MCAEGLATGLRRVLHADSVPLEAVKRVLLDIAAMNRLPPTSTAQWSESACVENLLVPQDQRRASKVVADTTQKLFQSAWAQIDLAQEDEVCDFLADRLCSDPSFVSEFEVLGLWLEGIAREAPRETFSLLQARRATEIASASEDAATAEQASTSRGEVVVNMSPQERKGRLEQLRLNLRAVLTIKLPKRSGGSILHVAAADGGYAVLSGVIRILKLILPCDEWERILDSRWICLPR
jgi:hypothetical protein